MASVPSFVLPDAVTTLATSTTSPLTVPEGNSSPTGTLGLIVGLAVGVPCFLILLTVAILVPILVFRRNKRRRVLTSQPSNVLLVDKTPGTVNAAFAAASSEETEVFVDIPEMAPRPIKVSEFLGHVRDHQADMNKYRTEFSLLPGSAIKSCSIGKKYPAKNRYSNILPFNENRVCLTDCGRDSDYINASFIDGYLQKKEYIATQGPLEETVNDFWRMIWEQDSRRVVMVTRVYEGEKMRCAQYWPPPLNKPAVYGAISVLTAREEEGVDFTTRTLQVTKGEERRVVTQFHFHTWPDQDAPDTCTAMLQFYQRVFRGTEHAAQLPEERGVSGGPVVIHCSAGVGRTGTLIALHILLQQAKAERRVDVQKCLERLRRQRVNMVQSTAQYIYLHHALLERLVAQNVETKNADFRKVYAELTRASGAGKAGSRRLQNQLSVLNALKQQFPPYLYGLALSEQNRSKNRLATLLPVDSYLPTLRPLDDSADTYINAVYVHGFRQPRAYIATQLPFAHTRTEFWRLVRDNACAVIVMLADLPGSAEQYWPEDGQTIVVGSFEITNICEIHTDTISVTDLRIVYTGPSAHGGAIRPPGGSDSSDAPSSSDPEEPLYANTLTRRQTADHAFQVRHIRLLDWVEGAAFPRDRSTLIELYNEVARCQEKNPGGRVLVHCLYGAERTGLFMSLMNVLDEIKVECVVDVFNSVKRVRRTRPEFIANLDQYKYLYEMASTYLSSLEKEDYYPESCIGGPAAAPL